MQLTIVNTEPLWTKNLFTNLQFPNKLFLLWAAKLFLEERLCISVCKHYNLAKQNICGGELLPQMNKGLQNEASTVRAQHGMI